MYTKVLIRVRLVDDDVALHLCSCTRGVVVERVSFLSVGVCFWVQTSGVQTKCVEHSEAFSFILSNRSRMSSILISHRVVVSSECRSRKVDAHDDGRQGVVTHSLPS